MVGWDPTRDGYILSHESYNNSILYILNCPTDRFTRKSHRMNVWLWNYITKTRTHLPPLYQQILGGTIWKHYLYVVARKKLKYRFYSLDLRQANSKWQLEDLLTKTLSSVRDFIPKLYNGNEYGIVIMYHEHFRLFHPETRTTMFRYFIEFFDPDWNTIDIVTIKDKLYCIREDIIYAYNIPSRNVIQHIDYEFRGSTILEIDNCKGTCVHVYDSRFMFVLYHNRWQRQNKFTIYWSVGCYDCFRKRWYRDPTQKFEMIDEDANPDYPNGLQHFLWESNSLCYMCCRVKEKYRDHNYDSDVETNIETTKSQQYHISYFFNNWNVIKSFILIRRLLKTKRATMKQSDENSVVSIIINIKEDELFRRVMMYLMCFDKNKYCIQ